jgi:hypothetical protein
MPEEIEITAEPTPEAPETFPMGLDEYASTVGLHYLWAAGLAAYAGPGDRYRTEWDALLAEFKDRPVTS